MRRIGHAPETTEFVVIAPFILTASQLSVRFASGTSLRAVG
jgi:hypothetical protein